MKANMWEFSELGEHKTMDRLKEEGADHVQEAWSHLGQTTVVGEVSQVERLLGSRRNKDALGLRQPPTITVD